MDAAREPARGAEPAVEETLPGDSPVPAMVYLAVGVGLTVCLLALLIARPSFDTVGLALALLTTAPFLLFARLAIARPGPEAVIAGVLLLAVGCTRSVAAIDDGTPGDFVQLHLSLVVLQLAVFAAGAGLRVAVPRSRPRSPGEG